METLFHAGMERISIGTKMTEFDETEYSLNEVMSDIFIGWMLSAQDKGFDFATAADSNNISPEAVQERYRIINFLIEERLTAALEDEETSIEDLEIQVGIVLAIGLDTAMQQFGSISNFYEAIEWTYSE